MPTDQMLQDIPSNFAWFVLNTITKMRDADASGDHVQYYTFFRYAINSLAPYMTGERREAVERDFKVMEGAIAKMKNTPNINPQTEEKNEEEIRKEFADSHTFLIFEALPKASIVKISQDAVIDFGKTEWQTLGLYIRGIAHSGMKSGLERGKESEERNGNDKTKV
jgi:hypothetical protein